jgi:hypothetical protein
MRSLPRVLGVVAVLGPAPAGCGGDIVFGSARGDGGSAITGADVGAQVADTGVVPRDGGIAGGMDAEAACPTTFPTGWPFPTTATAYRSHFWTSIGPTCSLGTACHGVNGTPPTHQPMIPEDANIQANLATSISDLMLKAQPGGSTARLSAHHRVGSLDNPNSFMFPAATQALVDAFVAELQSCSGCTGGTCTCAAPTACTQ